jgi:hypothetical protein
LTVIERQVSFPNVFLRMPGRGGGLIEGAERLRRMNSVTGLCRKPLLGRARLFAILAAEIVAFNILWTAAGMKFENFAFCDSGANLSIQYLVSHGYRPAIDFGYPYGLLPILLGRIWFAGVGATPIAYQILSLCFELGIGFAIARIAAALRFRGMSIAVILVALWFGVRAYYPSLTHTNEALILTLALSEQASGRKRSALMYASAAIFVKPSMGYVYLAWLIALWFRQTPRAARWKRLVPEVVIPIGIIGAVCAAVLSVVYGPFALIRTVLPLEGVAGYKVMDFGFFMGSGRFFWEPSHNSLLQYFLGVAGLWIFATVFLFFSAIWAAKRLLSDPNSVSLERSRDEIILTCFVLHAAFVCFFFGNQWSWIYYSYFLVIGVAASADLGPASRRAGFVVCCLCAFAILGAALAVLPDWNTQRPRAVTAWLWSPREQAAQWSQILEMTRGGRATILDSKGAAELMYPQFQPPVSLYLDPGLMKPSEVGRKVRQIGGSEWVIVPVGMSTCGGIPSAPEIRAAMTSFELVMNTRYFLVYRRTAPRPAS